jgi:glycosyltransferase involved in cell wall biosynthesis
MKISLINTWLSGGASKSAQRLFKGLKDVNRNYQLEFFIKNYKNKELAIIDNYKCLEEFSFLEKLKRKIKINGSNNEFNNYLEYRKREGLDYFSDIHNRSKNIQNEYLETADIINLHWVAELLDYSKFFSKFKQPIYWTLHDQSPFLCGNHYEENYSVDEKGNIFSREKSDLEVRWENRLRKEKLEVFKNVKNLEIIAPSMWMAESAKKSELFKDFNVHHIPNGLETNHFKLLDKHLSKDVFGLPKDKKVILFVSENIEVNRKGFKVLLRALEFIDNEDFAIAVVGKGNFEKPKELSHIPIFNLGTIIDERLMAMAYNTADLFVIPSLVDNLPNTAIEAICCGTPVVGFATGGIPDIIQHGYNGYLTDVINAESLAAQISFGLKNLSEFDYETISTLAREKYNLQKQARAYLELFERHT